jgi:hypothetical protein
MFVAVGYGGRRMSSPDGITWSNDQVVDPNGGDDNNLFRGVGFEAGQFIAVGGSSKGQIQTSPDGATWTSRDPGSSWLADVVAIGQVLVTAGGNGLRERSLDAGATWLDPTGYYAGHFRAIAAGNGLAVAVGHTYGQSPDKGLSSVTSDGKTWSPELASGATFGSVAFGVGVFVAAGQNRCSTTKDGKAWADCAGVSGGGYDGVVFANDRFVLGDANGYFVSLDGATWTHQNAEHHQVAAFGAGLYLAVEWPDRILSSPDLMTWTTRNHDTGPAFVQITLGSVN